MSDRIELIRALNDSSGFPRFNYKLAYTKGFKYLVFRVLRPILKFKFRTYGKKNDPCPWLAPNAVKFLNSYLEKNKGLIGAEFGSGKSSLFFISRVKKLVSIEHNKEWFDFVNKGFNESKTTNVDYIFHEQESEQNDPGTPVFYKEYDLDKNFQYRNDYWSYFHALENYEDSYFDFILVDGRARVECFLTSYKKLKSGGMMILDNSERERYTPIFELFSDLESITTTTGLTDTTFWVKP